MSELKFTLPTETVELPSKGVLYSKDNPLSSGQVEMKYMTAKEEDILTNQNYIQDGTVLDKLLKSMIIGDLNIDDMLLGDKNALIISSRILGYGKNYTFKTLVNGKLTEKTIDLTTLDEKPLITDTQLKSGENEFLYTLPNSKINITYKILTHKDELDIDKEISRLKKLFPEQTPPDISTRLKYMIQSVDGNYGTKIIRDFIDKGGLIAIDSKELRKEYQRISPDVQLLYKEDGEEDIKIPINFRFFWPE